MAEEAEDGAPFSGEVHVLLREVDGVFGERSAWVTGEYSGTLLPAGTCTCGAGSADPGSGPSDAPPAPLLAGARGTCERRGPAPDAGGGVHVDFGASFPGARRAHVLTRVVNAAHRAGQALPGARSDDPRFVPRVVGARAEGGLPQLELAVTLDAARGVVSENYLGAAPAAGWGGGDGRQDELREACLLYGAQSGMMHSLRESERAELAAEITVLTAPPQTVTAHAELVWPSIVRPARMELERSIKDGETAPAGKTLDFGSLPIDGQAVRRALGSPDELQPLAYRQATTERWLRVDNPLPDRPLRVRLLDARASGPALRLLNAGGCPPLLLGGESYGLQPDSVGKLDEVFWTDPSHREAAYSAVVAPGESVNLGPVLFQPLSEKRFSGHALVSNNLTGIEALPLSGTGAGPLVSMVTDGLALRITEEEMRRAQAAIQGEWNFGLHQPQVRVRKVLTFQNSKGAPLPISAIGIGGRSNCFVQGYTLEHCGQKFTVQSGQKVDIAVNVEWICEKPLQELELYLTEHGRQPVKYVFPLPQHARCGMSSKSTSTQARRWNVGNRSASETLGVLGLAFVAVAALALLSQPAHASALIDAVYGRASVRGAAARGAPAQKGARARAGARPEIDFERLHAVRARERGYLAYTRRYYTRLGNFASTLLYEHADSIRDDVLYYYESLVDRLRHPREAGGASEGALGSDPATAKEGAPRRGKSAGGREKEPGSRRGERRESVPGEHALSPVEAPPLVAEQRREAGSAEGGAQEAGRPAPSPREPREPREVPKRQADQPPPRDAPSLAGVDSSLRLSPEQSDGEDGDGEEAGVLGTQLAVARYARMDSPNSPLEREENMACERLLHERVVRVLGLGCERAKGEDAIGGALSLAGILRLCEAACGAGPPKYSATDLLDLLKGVTLAAPWKPLEKGHRRETMRQAVRRTVAVMCSSLLDRFDQYGRDEQILASVLQAYARMFMNPSLCTERWRQAHPPQGAAEPLWDRVNALVEKEVSNLRPDLIARVLSAFVFFERDCGLSPPPDLLAALHDRVLSVAPQTSQGTWDKSRSALQALGAGFEAPHGRNPQADDRATRVSRHPPAGDVKAPSAKQSRKPAPSEAKTGGGVQERPREKKAAPARRKKEHNAVQPPPTHRPAEGAESGSARAPNKAKRSAQNGPTGAQRAQGKASARRPAQQQQRSSPASQQPAEKAPGARRPQPPPAIPEILRGLAPRGGQRPDQPEQPFPVEMRGRPAPPRGQGGQQAQSGRSSLEAGGRVRDPSHPWGVVVPETFGADGMGTGTVSVLESLDILGAPDTDGQQAQQQQPSRVPASLFSIWQDDGSVPTALGPVSARPPTAGPGPTHQFGAGDFSALPEGGGGAMAAPVQSLGLQKLQDALDSRRDLPLGQEALRGSSGFPVNDPQNTLPDHFNPIDAETFGTDAGQWEATWAASDPYGYNYE